MDKPNARAVIASLFEEGYPAIDLAKLSDAQLKAYQVEAKNVIDSPVFINEVNKIIDSTIKAIALSSKSYEEVEMLRMSINGLMALKEELQDLAATVDTKKPNQEQSQTDRF